VKGKVPLERPQARPDRNGRTPKQPKIRRPRRRWSWKRRIGLGLILLIVLGDLIQQGVTQSDYSFTGLVLAGGTFTLLTVGVSYLVFRFRRVRPLFEPEPLILVEDGKVIEPNLRRERLTTAELAAEARLQQIPSLADVRWAVLETSGKISFIPRQL